MVSVLAPKIAQGVRINVCVSDTNLPQSLLISKTVHISGNVLILEIEKQKETFSHVKCDLVSPVCCETDVSEISACA